MHCYRHPQTRAEGSGAARTWVVRQHWDGSARVIVSYFTEDFGVIRGGLVVG